MTPEKRKPLTRREFGLLIIQQDGKCGCGCGSKLDFTKPRRVVDEHLTPLFSLGSNELENRALWTADCANEKTRNEAPVNAKVRRHMNSKTQAANKSRQREDYEMTAPERYGDEHKFNWAKALLLALVIGVGFVALAVVTAPQTQEQTDD